VNKNKGFCLEIPVTGQFRNVWIVNRKNSLTGSSRCIDHNLRLKNYRQRSLAIGGFWFRHFLSFPGFKPRETDVDFDYKKILQGGYF